MNCIDILFKNASVDKDNDNKIKILHNTQDDNIKKVHKENPKNRIHENNCSNISHAVTNSRDVCKLKYIVGCSPILYGIPFT